MTPMAFSGRKQLVWYCHEKTTIAIEKFETIRHIIFKKILETSKDSEEGYILEKDLQYPDKLHDGHEDFQLTPTKKRIYYKSEEESRQTLPEKMDEIRCFGQGKQLIQSLCDKKKYITVHCTTSLFITIYITVH